MFVCLIQIVEDMEKGFLRGFLAAQKLNVVNHEYVAGTVFFSETVAFFVATAADYADKVVYYCFGVYIDDFCFGRFLFQIVADCVQKVSFSKTDAAVNEKRVIFSTGIFRNGFCGGKGIFVGFALNKRVESVFFEKLRAFFLFLRSVSVNNKPFVGKCNALFFEICVLLVLYNDFNVGHKRIQRRDNLFYLVAVAVVDVFFCGCRNCGKHKSVVHKTHRFELFYPDFVAYRLHSFRQLVFDVAPEFFFADHRGYYNQTT